MPDEKADRLTLGEYFDIIAQDPEDPRLDQFRAEQLANVRSDEEGRQWLADLELEIQRRKSRSRRIDLRQNKGV